MLNNFNKQDQTKRSVCTPAYIDWHNNNGPLMSFTETGPGQLVPQLVPVYQSQVGHLVLKPSSGMMLA